MQKRFRWIRPATALPFLVAFTLLSVTATQAAGPRPDPAVGSVWTGHPLWPRTAGALRMGELAAGTDPLALAVAVVAAQEGPVAVMIRRLEYDPRADVYRLTLGLANPSEVQLLVVSVEDQASGTVVEEYEVNVRRRPSIQLDIDSAHLKPGREYLITVQAVDWDDLLIEKPSDGSHSEDAERFVQASKEFQYEPPEPEPVEFAIESVNADYTSGRVIIALSVTGLDRVETYQGFINDQDTGQRVCDIPLQLLKEPLVAIPMPAAIRDAQQAHSYLVKLYLTTDDGLRAEAVYEGFKPIPPPPPSRWKRLWDIAATVSAADAFLADQWSS